MKFALLATLLSTVMFVQAASEPIAIRNVEKRAPQIDGLIHEGEYAEASTFVGAYNYRDAARGGGEASADPRESECAFTWDENFLYLATRSRLTPNPKNIHAVSGESVEFWFDLPEEARTAEFAKFGQFQLAVNWKGGIVCNHHNPGYGLPRRNWKAGLDHIKVACSVRGELWDCEIAIPAAAFGLEKFSAGCWGVILGRNYATNPVAQRTYVPFAASGGYTVASAYQKFNLVTTGEETRYHGNPKLIMKAAPFPVPYNFTVKARVTGKMEPLKWRRFFASQCRPGTGYFGVQLVTNHDGSEHVTMFFHPNKPDPERPLVKTSKNATFNQVPPEDEDVYLSFNVFKDRVVFYMDGAQIGEIKSDAPITADDMQDWHIGGGEPGIQILSIRGYDRALTDDEIRIAAQGNKGLVGNLLWYPSLSSLACEISFPKPKGGKDDLPVLTVYDTKGKPMLETRLPSKRESCVKLGGKRPVVVVHEIVPLTEGGKRLPEGKYRAVLTTGKDRKVEIEKTFINKNYEWFNTTVARQDILLPGFTPVKASDTAIETVGRKYVFGANGLPKEIWSLGEQLLARPVSLTAGGEEILDGGFRLGKCRETQAEYAAPNMTARVEQDGFLVMDISLPETKGEVVFDIPIKPEFAKLMHASGEGMRSNPGGFLKEGTGRIFGSREIPQNHVDNFIPYCWVGTDTRGISYACDNEQGWEHCAEKDAVEVIRETDGTVLIRLNLITGAGDHEARDFRLCLQASPVKPMPKGWRGWVDAFDVPGERNTLCNCSNPTWGCYIVGMARYPSFMDFTYIDKVAEAAKTGKVDKPWVEKWIDRCLTALERHPEKVPWLVKQKGNINGMKTNLRNHAFAGLNRVTFLADKKNTVLYYYTCNADPCDGLYELDVMADEWGLFTAVYGSHSDYALYYLKKMCEHGMTGVYNDNAFFRCNFDWVTGGAWIDKKGAVHPSFSLFHIRDFTKRQILAMLEAGVKDPWLTIHHTNANILPMLGFATNTMGMEWKYGNSEYQDRYTRDYIRTVNQGYQGGFFATSLEGIFDCTSDAQKTRVTRTMLAALLPHEVQPTLQACGDHNLVCKALRLKQEFGIGKDSCQYRAYYDPENWMVQTNPDVMISAYRQGGRMLLVIGSYSDTDVDLELRLKSGAIVSARNTLDDKSVKVQNGVGRLPLKNRDCAIVQLEVK